MKHNKILYIFLTGVLVFILSTPGFSKKPKDAVVGSKWAQKPIGLDGLNNEWADITLNKNNKTLVDYAFMNDAQNLYILFIFKNPKFLSTISLTGMKIFFSPQGTKKKNSGIKFVARQISADGYITMLEKEMGPVSETQKKQIRANPSYIIFCHEIISGKPTGELKILGPQFKSKRQQKTFVYEFMIPLKKLAELSSEIGAEPGKDIQVGFEWGGQTKETMEALAAKIGQSGVTSGSNSATGLTSERRVGGGVSSNVEYGGTTAFERMRRSQPKKYNFWVNLRLAESK